MLVDRLRDSIQGLAFECLRNLPVHKFLQYPKSCKLVSKGFAGLSELWNDFFQGRSAAATQFIDENQCFLRPHRETELSYDGTLYGRTTFHIVEGLSQYLLDESKSGPLHFCFRDTCLNICQSMLITCAHPYSVAEEMDLQDGTPALELKVDWLVFYIFQLYVVKSHVIALHGDFSTFLRYTLEFSNIRYDQDPMDFQKILAFIDALHDIAWIGLNSETCQILIEWIDRQLVRSLSSSSFFLIIIVISAE